MFDEINTMTFRYGSIEYHSTARIVSMRASALPKDADYSLEGRRKPRIVVVTAGTSDIPIAEEAAVTLEATKACTVDRVYDAGVAGLHRILQALDRLTHPDVGCIICCAGMDGALPSVVGGLVAVPVVAVPTSIGYGASLGGLCAMMTMMNSCSPGVCVVNIDNGFGAAALALKVIRVGETGHIERND
jgi:NCAIR mutase (PurE)-related protein